MKNFSKRIKKRITTPYVLFFIFSLFVSLLIVRHDFFLQLFSKDKKTSDVLTQELQNIEQIFESEDNSEELTKSGDIQNTYKTTTDDNVSGDSEYYVQVGSWKDPVFAKEMLLKLRKAYPEIELSVQKKDSDAEKHAKTILKETSAAAEAEKVAEKKKKVSKPVVENEDIQLIAGRNDKQDINIKGTEPVISEQTGGVNTEEEKPAESVQTDEAAEITEKSAEEEKAPVIKKPLTRRKPARSREYYIQVCAWKNASFAREMFAKVKQYYPDTYIIKQDNFHKVRIPGIKTPDRGKAISRDIEKKFFVKPIVVLKTHKE